MVNCDKPTISMVGGKHNKRGTDYPFAGLK